MNLPKPKALHESSRLAVCLQELDLAGKRHEQQDVVERLADLIDLSDAFTLSEQLRSLPRLRFSTAAGNDPANTAQAIKTHFVQERSAMMAAIVQKSTPGPDNRLLGMAMPDSFDVLQRFYTLQQSEMEHQVLKLRLHLREAMRGISRETEQLLVLDAALADAVGRETRHALAALPRLLHKHYVRLKPEPEGYPQFIRAMQNLLLAELDTRLQPLIGLVEALDEKVGM
jgi:hypothetical protein